MINAQGHQDFFSAYQPLSEEESLQLNQELNRVESETMRAKIMQLTNPFIEQGIRKGRHEGEAELVLRLLNRRLGALPASQKSVIRKLDLAKIEALGESLLAFECRADLARWLKQNAS